MASITVDRILAAAPVTLRGQPTPLSADPKGQRIAYAVSAYTTPGVQRREAKPSCLEVVELHG